MSGDRTSPGPRAALAGGADAVYPIREDSLLLLPFARVPAGSSLLEIGAGSGLAALTAARAGAGVLATDLNPHALQRLRGAARAEGLAVGVVRTDLARGVGRFDRILANPPYLPTREEERDPDRWHNLALDGGPDGTRVTARLVGSLPHHLRPRGKAFVVVSSLQSAPVLAGIRESWEARGGRVRTVADRALEGERLEVWRFVPAPQDVPA
jgi:release factor glutamine methyltransferase